MTRDVEDIDNHALTNILGDLAIELQHEPDAESTLLKIVHGAVRVVPGARWAGVSLIEGKEVIPHAPTDPLVADLDGLQSDLDEGPCMDALREQRTVYIPDMQGETRWPQFAKAASRRGVRSLMSFQLFVSDQNLGAMNLYGDAPDAFDDDSKFIGTVLAQHASVALAADVTTAQLHRAVSSRDLIGQAKGLLMHRDDISGLQAFNLLLKASQDTNMKLTDVARWLVDSHEKRLGDPPKGGQVKSRD